MVLEKDLMAVMDSIQPKGTVGSSDFFVNPVGCGCSGSCGQSCSGGCEAGCTGDCGRSCSGSGS